MSKYLKNVAKIFIEDVSLWNLLFINNSLSYYVEKYCILNNKIDSNDYSIIVNYGRNSDVIKTRIATLKEAELLEEKYE